MLVNNPSAGEDVDTVFNSGCFVQYDVERDGSNTIPPDNWTVCL